MHEQNDADTDRLECGNCHDFHPRPDMVDMDGIADGQHWCRNCAEEFGAFLEGGEL